MLSFYALMANKSVSELFSEWHKFCGFIKPAINYRACAVERSHAFLLTHGNDTPSGGGG